MRAEDRQQLARALDAATAAAGFAGLPSVDDDKDLVALGRAVRERRLQGFALPLAREAIRLRQGVIERNLPLAWDMARIACQRYAWVRYDDARQVAAEALTQAVARYRPGKAASDSGWLSTWVFRTLERWARREARAAGEAHDPDEIVARCEKSEKSAPVDLERLLDLQRAATRRPVRRAIRRMAQRHFEGAQWTQKLLADRRRVLRAIEEPAPPIKEWEHDG